MHISPNILYVMPSIQTEFPLHKFHFSFNMFYFLYRPRLALPTFSFLPLAFASHLLFFDRSFLCICTIADSVFKPFPSSSEPSRLTRSFFFQLKRLKSMSLFDRVSLSQIQPQPQSEKEDRVQIQRVDHLTQPHDQIRSPSHPHISFSFEGSSRSSKGLVRPLTGRATQDHRPVSLTLQLTPWKYVGTSKISEVEPSGLKCRAEKG